MTGMHLYAHDRIRYDYAARWKKSKRKPIFINKEANPSELYFKVLTEKDDKAWENIKDL